MLLQQLQKRLRDEYTALCSYLATAPITNGDLIKRAYELVWKEEIVILFESIPETGCRYSDRMLSWIMDNPNSLDFLYEVWLHTDYLLTSEVADLMYDELSIRKDGDCYGK